MFGRNQIVVQGKRLAGLRAGVEAARVGMEELGDKRLANPCGKLAVSPGVVLLAEQLGEAGNQHRLMVVERRAGQGDRLGVEALVVANALVKMWSLALRSQELELPAGDRILLPRSAAGRHSIDTACPAEPERRSASRSGTDCPRYRSSFVECPRRGDLGHAAVGPGRRRRSPAPSSHRTPPCRS